MNGFKRGTLLCALLALLLLSGAALAAPPEPPGGKYFTADLFDYAETDPDAIADAITAAQPNVERSRYFSFIGDGAVSEGFSDVSAYTGSGGGIVAGLVKERMSGNTVAYADGIAGIDLFDTGSQNYTCYNSVHFPFIYSNGYYVYDSDNASAALEKSSRTVALGPANGGFWPFGQGKTHFGAHFTMDFYIPKAKLVGGKAMVFSFSGDDDVWVFVDGRLALDLGGIHDTYGGSINFTDGSVSVPRVYGSYSPQSGNVSGRKGPYTYTDSYIAGLTENSVHRLDVFYLERGASDSNCAIKFNLPEYEPLIIKKDVTGLTEGSNAGPGFDFLIKTAPTAAKSASAAPYSGKFKLYRSGAFIDDVAVTDGRFTLYDNEEARFDSLLVDTYFEVEELSASAAGFDTHFSATAWVEQNDLVSSQGAKISGTLVPDSAARDYLLTCENTRRVISVPVSKTDKETGSSLPGAVFLLSGTSDRGESIVVRATSTDAGAAVFTGIPAGTYRLSELTAPENYIGSSSVYTVKVENSLSGLTVSFTDSAPDAVPQAALTVENQHKATVSPTDTPEDVSTPTNTPGSTPQPPYVPLYTLPNSGQALPTPNVSAPKPPLSGDSPGLGFLIPFIALSAAATAYLIIRRHRTRKGRD